jgi:hypothetical protein
MPAVITLVHGTWGQQSDWVREHSPLRVTFETALKDLVFFRTFFWSGSNSFAARGTAAEDLKSFLREGLELFPTATHSVISHSHGGNIVLKALEDDLIRSKISGVVCLSTPFLTVAARNFGSPIGFTSKWFHLGLAVIAAIFIDWRIAPLRRFSDYALSTGNSHLLATGFLLMFIAETWIAWLVIVIPAELWRGRAEEFRTTQTIRPVSDLRLLVIRPPADEASGALTTTQFLAWLATGLWQAIALLQTLLRSALRKWKTWSKRRKISSTLIAFGMFLLVLFTGNALPALSRSEWYVWLTILVLCALAGEIYVQMVIIILLAVATVIVGLLVLPLITILSIAVVPFSPLDAFLMGPLQIAAEATPVGRCEILQLPSTGGAGLMHSSTYENPVALEASAAWILRDHSTLSLSPQQSEEWKRSKSAANQKSAAGMEELTRNRRRARTRHVVGAVVLTILLIITGRFLWQRWQRHRTDSQLTTVTYTPSETMGPSPAAPTDIIVTRTAHPKNDDFHVTFQLPVNSTISNRTFTYIDIYGYKEGDGNRPLLVPVYRELRGQWHAGDRIAIFIVVPKEYADGLAGMFLRFRIGDSAGYSESPNLLIGNPLK